MEPYIPFRIVAENHLMKGIEYLTPEQYAFLRRVLKFNDPDPADIDEEFKEHIIDLPASELYNALRLVDATVSLEKTHPKATRADMSNFWVMIK